MQNKVDQLKAQLSDLKKQLRALKTQKSNGNMIQARSKKQAPKQATYSVKMRRNLTGHFGKVMAVDCHRSIERVVSASQDGKMLLWNGFTGNKLESITMSSVWVLCCSFEQENGHFVASAGLDNCCTVHPLGYPSNPQERTVKLSYHNGYISSCLFMSTSKILTTSGDKLCCISDIETAKMVSKFSGHSADVMCSSIVPDKPNMFISGSCDSTAKVWDIRTGKATHTFFGHDSDINAIKMFPDGNCFGSGSEDTSCRLFDIRSYGELHVLSNPKISSGVTSCKYLSAFIFIYDLISNWIVIIHPILFIVLLYSTVSFSKSGQLLFAGYDDYCCRGWSTTALSDMPLMQLYGHENRVSSLVVPPDGECICTSSWDSTLKVIYLFIMMSHSILN